MAKSLYGDSFRNVLPAVQTGGNDQTGYIVIDGTLIGGGFPIIVTQWQIALREKTHVLESFNEHVHAYAFGRGVGSAVIAGHSLESQSGNKTHGAAKNLKSQYESQLRALAAARASGGLIRVSGPGGLTVSGVANSLEMSIGGAQSNILNFTMQFLILDSSLGAAS
jgi:hypothetical protein